MKKGYFFVLDAFVALAVIVISLVLIFSFHTQKPYQIQSITLADDVMKYLSSTKVSEVYNSYVFSLYKGGAENVSDVHNSILEQAAEFFVTGHQDIGTRFTYEVTRGVVPERYGSEFWIYNESHKYNVTINPGQTSQEESRILVVSKELVLGNIDEELQWGPMIAEVRVWD